jgi:hypothetical protein
LSSRGWATTKTRGEYRCSLYRFSSLVKLTKGGKITLSFTSPEKEFCFHIYDVITWEKIKKSSDITTAVGEEYRRRSSRSKVANALTL